MKIYDSQIERVRELFNGIIPKKYEYCKSECREENAQYEMIFQSDMAYELGANKERAVNLTCVSSNAQLFNDKDEILVYGDDLCEILDASSYARITEVLVKDDLGDDSNPSDMDKLYKIIQDIDFVKYHMYTKGFMIRTSGQSCLEQVRVSKNALKEKVSFEHIGNSFIKRYRDNPNVLHVRIIFVTTANVDFDKLKKEADTAIDIRRSLSMIHNGLPTECGSCEIKDICDEVEGLRELHFGSKENGDYSKKKIEKSPITQALGRT